MGKNVAVNVQQNSMREGFVTLDISSLSNAVYQVRLIGTNSTIVKRLVKE